MHEVRDNNKQESFAVLDLAADQRSKPVALLLGQANRYERVKGRFSLHRYEDVSGDSSRGLRARKAATISGKAPARLLPVLDCKKMFSSSRKTRQRNPSHFGSYIHSLPMGKLFTATAGVSCSHFASRYSKWAFSRRCCNFDSLYSARVESKKCPL